MTNTSNKSLIFEVTEMNSDTPDVLSLCPHKHRGEKENINND